MADDNVIETEERPAEPAASDERATTKTSHPLSDLARPGGGTRYVQRERAEAAALDRAAERSAQTPVKPHGD